MAAPQPLFQPTGSPARVAAFMSGSGSNVTRLLELQQKLSSEGACPFNVVAIVTDNPDPHECKAREIAASFGDLPLIELDIKAFYRDRGHPRVSVKTDRGYEIREEYSDALWQKLQPFGPGIIALGGFVPLTNLVGKLPAINVHPGDLSVLREGQRYLVGLHTIPIKRAILAGLSEVRSTTILATPYTKKVEMDEGPVLMISRPLPIELPEGVCPDDLKGKANRDRLEQIAKEHQNRLKEVGDWEIFPLTVKLVAEGRFAMDEDKAVYFDGERLECGLRLPNDRVGR